MTRLHRRSRGSLLRTTMQHRIRTVLTAFGGVLGSLLRLDGIRPRSEPANHDHCSQSCQPASLEAKPADVKGTRVARRTGILYKPQPFAVAVRHALLNLNSWPSHSSPTYSIPSGHVVKVAKRG